MIRVLLILFPYLIISACYSQTNEEDIIPILKKVKEIDADIDRYEKTYFNEVNIIKDSFNNNYSCESSELYEIIETDIVKYFDDNKLTKIEVVFFGTHENLQSEYYFQDEQLVFVRKIKTVFHKSRYHKDFDESKISMLRTYFYFNNGNLIRWSHSEIDSEGRTKNKRAEGKMNSEYSRKESTILHDAEFYHDFSNAHSQ